MAAVREAAPCFGLNDFEAVAAPRYNRWTKLGLAIAPPTPSAEAADSEASSGDASPVADHAPRPPLPHEVQRKPRTMGTPSYILQHYHSTGCAGGAFSWRAAMMDPEKCLRVCKDLREYRETSTEDIMVSKADKRRGGGPRVGPLQETIPGNGWKALPKYDFTTTRRSSAFNERMHVEWENHVDHILKNGGQLPTASVVAKAGFRSCAPCCRDMLALARPTGKTFIMVDLAEDDTRGTFHFVTGDRYLPVAKEACTAEQVRKLKKIALDAQACRYETSEAIYSAVNKLDPPIDTVAQAMYLGDRALLPAGCATNIEGTALLGVLHAEHFARLSAEYGASMFRDPDRPKTHRDAISECRARARQMLIDAWRPFLTGIKVDLEVYAHAATAPLLSEEPRAYLKTRHRASSSPNQHEAVTTPATKEVAAPAGKDERRWSVRGPTRRAPTARLSENNVKVVTERSKATSEAASKGTALANEVQSWRDDSASTALASTAVPEEDAASWGEDVDDPDDIEQ